MESHKTLALLLKKIPLANDDALLEFWTQRDGRLTVRIRNFAKSKLSPELDFFRLLEIVYIKGRSTNTLKSALTVQVFQNITTDYSSVEWGFAILQKLAKLHFNEKDSYRAFDLLVFILSHYEKRHRTAASVFLTTRIFDFMGILPHFDLTKKSADFLTATHEIKPTPGGEGDIEISYETQVLAEHLREISPEKFFATIKDHSTSEIEALLLFLKKINH